MASCLFRLHGGVLAPASIGKRLNLSTGAQVKVAQTGDVIKVAAADADLAAAYPVEVSRPGMFPLPGPMKDRAGIRPGSVLLFEPAGDGIWTISVHAQDDLPEFGAAGADSAGRPLPPEWLIQAFSNMPDQAMYLNSGRATWAWIETTVANLDLALPAGSTILDFGCGCARVLRHIDPRTYTVAGCDLHSPGIDWCRTHMPHGRFEHGFTAPPTNLDDASVDLLIAISVLTHLDEDMQHGWLSEWSRMMRPGGIVMSTFNGDDFVEKNLVHAPDYRQNILDQFEATGGFAFVSDDGWSGVFPTFYQTAYHDRSYVASVWGEYFEVLKVIPSGGFTNKQNMAIMRKR